MRRPLASLLVVIALCSATTARAASSAEAPPADSRKEGGIAGDTRGAIRALGGTAESDFKQSGKPVDVPKLGGGASGKVGGPPAGTGR